MANECSATAGPYAPRSVGHDGRRRKHAGCKVSLVARGAQLDPLEPRGGGDKRRCHVAENHVRLGHAVGSNFKLWRLWKTARLADRSGKVEDRIRCGGPQRLSLFLGDGYLDKHIIDFAHNPSPAILAGKIARTRPPQKRQPGSRFKHVLAQWLRTSRRTSCRREPCGHCHRHRGQRAYACRRRGKRA